MKLKFSVKIFCLCVLTSAAACLISCSKKDAAGGAWFNNELTKHLPPNTAGFVVWDSNQPGYEKYRLEAAAAGSSDDLLSSLAALNGGEQGSGPGQIAEALKKSGISIMGGSQSDTFAKGVIFVAPAEGSEAPIFGAYLRGASNSNLEEKLNALQKTLASDGHKIEKIETSSGSGFALNLKESPESRYSKIYAAYNKDFAAISSSAAAAEALFKPSDIDGLGAISSKDNFKAALVKLGDVGGFFSFAFADAKSFAKAIYSSVPPEAKVGSSFRPEEVPLKTILAGRAMNESITDTVIITADDQTENGKKLIAGLKSVGRLKSVANTPGGALLSLSVDGAALARIRDAALNEVEPATRQAIEKELALLASLKSLSLGVLQSAGGSPFPGVMLSAAAADPAALTISVDAKISETVASAGLPLGQWQTKEIDGSQVKFIQSPIGIGIYLAQTADGVLLATSEDVVSSAAKTSSGKIKSLSASLPDGVKTNLEDRNNIFAAYINFAEIGGLIESAQGTLAMFTGGSASPEITESIDKLKKMGAVAVAAGFDDDAIRVQSDYILSPKAQG